MLFLAEQFGRFLLLHCVSLLVNLNIMFYMAESHIVGFSLVPPCWLLEILVL